VTVPLHIDTIAVLGGGAFGLMHCPGRCDGHYGARDLTADLGAVEAWGAALMISLNESREFSRLGVPNYATVAASRQFVWRHVPIPDMQTPGVAFWNAWTVAGPDIAAALDRHEKIAVHCAAGLGRTGTLVAKLLVDRGLAAEAAIALVRAYRPGTIETTAQEAFVRTARTPNTN
jgi:ADP-ribosyl-[dinitrogen reductase] hydrolase